MDIVLNENLVGTSPDGSARVFEKGTVYRCASKEEAQRAVDRGVGRWPGEGNKEKR